MKDSLIIDTIILMLQSKWYVRCWYDWFREDHFDYVSSNLDEILKSFPKPQTIKLTRLLKKIPINNDAPEVDMRMVYNDRTEEYEPEMYYKPIPHQSFDILINLNQTTIEKVEAMFGIKDDEEPNTE